MEKQEKIYALKNTPSDFIVEEQSDMSLRLSESGDYAHVEVRKEEMNTEQAARILTDAFHLNPKDIAYAGLKDKQAVTTQVFSIRHVSKEAIGRFTHPQLQLKLMGFCSQPVFIGSHGGNRFTIKVHFTAPGAKEAFEEGALRLERQPTLVNYFDEQRFSIQNVQVGLLFLTKRFKEACELLRQSENNPGFNSFWEQNPTNPVGALKKIPKLTLLLYIHSVQSVMFNNALAAFVRLQGKENHHDVSYTEGTLSFSNDLLILEGKAVPLPGFGMDHTTVFEKFLQQEFTRLGIGERDFILRQFPEISCEGSMRKATVPISGFEIREITDAYATISFTLPKGAYATMMFKQIFYA